MHSLFCYKQKCKVLSFNFGPPCTVGNSSSFERIDMRCDMDDNRVRCGMKYKRGDYKVPGCQKLQMTEVVLCVSTIFVVDYLTT